MELVLEIFRFLWFDTLAVAEISVVEVLISRVDVVLFLVVKAVEVALLVAVQTLEASQVLVAQSRRLERVKVKNLAFRVLVPLLLARSAPRHAVDVLLVRTLRVVVPHLVAGEADRLQTLLLSVAEEAEVTELILGVEALVREMPGLSAFVAFGVQEVPLFVGTVLAELVSSRVVLAGTRLTFQVQARGGLPGLLLGYCRLAVRLSEPECVGVEFKVEHLGDILVVLVVLLVPGIRSDFLVAGFFLRLRLSWGLALLLGLPPERQSRVDYSLSLLDGLVLRVRCVSEKFVERFLFSLSGRMG